MAEPFHGSDLRIAGGGDTAVASFFQCLAVDLTNGENTVALRATDLAGNTSVTSFSYTLNSDTTPPVLTLGWPQDGMTLCGGTFTVDGWLDDPTAAITLSYVDGQGNPQTVAGVVERDGRFWVEDGKGSEAR